MILTKPKTFAIIEDSQEVCKNIETRMQTFADWKHVGSTGFINQALAIVQNQKPSLLFLDWQIKGGSTFEILDYIAQSKSIYQPYIVFFTGYKSDEAHIAIDIINKYKVQKFISKPIYENLTQNLAYYVEEASNQLNFGAEILIKDIFNQIHKINPMDIVCICNNDDIERVKEISLSNGTSLLTKSTLEDIAKILDNNNIAHNFPNKRKSIVAKQHIKSIKDNFIYFRTIAGKLEINKENEKQIREWFVG